MSAAFSHYWKGVMEVGSEHHQTLLTGLVRHGLWMLSSHGSSMCCAHCLDYLASTFQQFLLPSKLFLTKTIYECMPVSQYVSVDIKVKCNSTFTSIGKSKISAATTWHHVTTRHVPPPRVTWHRKHKLWRGAKNRQLLKVWCNHQSTKASLCLKDSSYAMVFIWIYLVGCGVCRMAGLRQSSVVVIIYASICPLSLQHNIGPLIQPATAQITSCSNTNNK